MSCSPWLRSVRAHLQRKMENKKGKNKSPGDRIYARYEAKLKRAKTMAYISNFFYGFTWFLGFCALTWASAVILGGLLGGLTRHDYYSTVALLVLESVRLATTTFFGKVITLKLVHGSTDPQFLKYDTAAPQIWAGLLRIFEQTVQLMVLCISIIVPIRRLFDLADLVTDIPNGQFDAMKSSLRIFYVLVLVNASIATLAVLFSTHLVPYVLDSHSLRKFYGKIVWMGMDAGVLHATDFDFLAWAFQVQADEYRSNERALVVKKVYKDLLEFLYFHPKHKGFEAAMVALDSDDTYKREAAANIVGLWVALAEEMEQSESKGGFAKERQSNAKIASASSSAVAAAAAAAEAELKVLGKKKKTELSRLSMQTKLLAKLADALDNTETGRAASLSFESLANSDAKSVLIVASEGKDQKVADILMDQIHMTVEIGRPKNALTYIKAMIPLLLYLFELPETERSGGGIKNGIEKYCKPGKLRRLKQDMWTIVSEYPTGLKRLQAVAAYAYYLSSTEEECKITEKDLRKYLLTLPDDRSAHVLDEEVEYLKKVLGEEVYTNYLKDNIKHRPLKAERVDLPPVLARRTTSLIASLATIGIIVVAASFIIKDGNI